MSSKDIEGAPAQPTVSRQFDISTALGKIEGLISGLADKTVAFRDTTLACIHCIPDNIAIMSAKNKLTYRGSSDDDPEEFIKGLKYLQMANGWNDSKLLGNALFSLKDHARHWYETQPENSFADADDANHIPKFKNFETKFLAKFKKDETQSDVMCEVLNSKQQRGQSVTDYLSVVLPLLARITGINDEFKCGIVLNGLLPSLKSQLVLKEVKTLADLELWAKRVEKLTHVHKTSSVSTVDEETEEEVAVLSESQGARPKYHVQPVQGVKSNQNYNTQKGNSRPGQNYQNRNNGYRQTSFQGQNPGYRQNNYQGQASKSQSVGNFSHRFSQPKSTPGPCFTCGGPHLKRSCPTTKYGARYGTQYYEPGPCFICGGPHFQRSCGYARQRGGRQGYSYRNVSSRGRYRQQRLN